MDRRGLQPGTELAASPRKGSTGHKQGWVVSVRMSCGDGTVASGSLAAGSHLGHRAAISPAEVQSSSTLSEREGSQGQAGMQLPHSTRPAGLGCSASQPWPFIQTSRSAGERVVLGLHPCFWSAVGASAAQLPTSPLDPRP